MHAVTLNPPSVELTAGGEPVEQVATITDVPPDTTVSQVMNVTVGGTVSQVETTVTVDNPNPVVDCVAASPSYALTVGLPQQTSEPTTWTVKLTYQA